MLSFAEYQKSTARTCNASEDNFGLSILTLGLVGEAGEVADAIKKEIGHGHPRTPEQVTKVATELGDLLWYMSRIAARYDLDLCDIAEMNLKKLWDRYPAGFEAERSINRKDS